MNSYKYRLSGYNLTRKEALADAKRVRQRLGSAKVKKVGNKYYIYTKRNPRI